MVPPSDIRHVRSYFVDFRRCLARGLSNHVADGSVRDRLAVRLGETNTKNKTNNHVFTSLISAVCLCVLGFSGFEAPGACSPGAEPGHSYGPNPNECVGLGVAQGSKPYSFLGFGP